MYKLQWAKRDPLYEGFFESGTTIRIEDEAYPKHAHIEGIIYPAVMLMSALSLYSEDHDDLAFAKVGVQEEKAVGNETFLIVTEGFLHSTLHGYGFRETLIARLLEQAKEAGATRVYVFVSDQDDRQIFEDAGFQTLLAGKGIRDPLLARSL